MSEFVAKQLLHRIDSSAAAADVYRQMKINNVLRIVLCPIEIAKNSVELFDVAVMQFVTNVFTDDRRPNDRLRLRLRQLMSIALLDVVPLDRFVDIVYRHRSESVSSSVLLLVLSAVADSDDIGANVAAQSLLLFYHISRRLIDDNRLVLSNDDLPMSDYGSVGGGERDDFDFEMNEDHIEKVVNDDDEDDEEEGDGGEGQLHRGCGLQQGEMSAVEREIALILKNRFCQQIVPLAVTIDDDGELLDALGHLYHLLVLDTKLVSSSQSKSFILSLIQTSATISRSLWRSVATQKSRDTDRSLMQSLIGGQLRSVDYEGRLFFGKLLCLANCLHWRLLSVQDLDLVAIGTSAAMEFGPDELCEVVLKLRDIMYGLVLLIYDSKSSSTSMGSGRSGNLRGTAGCQCHSNEKLARIFTELQRVVTRLYNRDVRKGLRGLAGGKRLDWVKPDICRNALGATANQLLLDPRYRFGETPIGGGGATPLPAAEQRQLVVLREMPFIVPIGTRMRLFQQLLAAANVTVGVNGGPSGATTVRVRRDFLYEDAFNQLSSSSMSTVNRRGTVGGNLKVEFVDRFGMLEAGVDGGGLLREFLGALVKAAIDPQRGLFVATSNNLLYPNPELDTLYPDNWRAHLAFFGRMLGLMIARGLLVEAPFAPFFLQKLFGGSGNNRDSIDIDNLQHLDEDLYRNLLSLKSMPSASLEEVNLDFTVSRSCYGLAKVVELKPRGELIAVTSANRIEYIYLVADYKLNRQIAPQTAAIVGGLDEVLPVRCFRLFDADEIAFIIAGSHGGGIDVGDLRRNTVYHGVDDPDRSAVIANFWTVLADMSEEEKRSFVQFVTSVSRPPMLGFGELSPKFAIQIVPDTDRLPTASTCINLLKLPAYGQLEEMRQKLLYAIGSDSGFHLS